MRISSSFIIKIVAALVLLLVWAPWLNDEEIHDRVLEEKAHIDGTMGWVTYPDGSKRYELICDYKVMWLPFGRYVASCEGGYYVTFWNQIIP